MTKKKPLDNLQNLFAAILIFVFILSTNYMYEATVALSKDPVIRPEAVEMVDLMVSCILLFLWYLTLKLIFLLILWARDLLLKETKEDQILKHIQDGLETNTPWKKNEHLFRIAEILEIDARVLPTSTSSSTQKPGAKITET